MIRFLRKYGFLVLSICFASIFILFYQRVFHREYSSEIKTFQKDFNYTTHKLHDFLLKKKSEIERFGVDSISQQNNNDPFFFHIYKSDSLVYWNTNQLPLGRFADLHYPAKGVVHLQNGWYYSDVISTGNTTLAASFLIKKDYQYENKNLRNDFNPQFSIPFKGSVVLEKENAYPIYKAGQFIFALYPYEVQPIPSSSSDLLLAFLLLTISFSLIAIHQRAKRLRTSFYWLVPILIFVIRLGSLKGNWLSFLEETTAFQPTLYASSEWFPNFGEFLINCILLLYLCEVVSWRVNQIIRLSEKSIKTGYKIAFFGMYVIGLVFSIFIADIYRGLVENASIPLEVNKLFSLNFYSFLAMVAMGILFYGYYQWMRTAISAIKKSVSKMRWLLLIWLISSIAYLVFDLYVRHSMLILSCWPILINLLIFIEIGKFKSKQHFAYGVIVLFIFSVYVSMNLQEYYDIKEKQERELYANQLASDQDITTEVEYTNLAPKLQTDSYLQKLIKYPERVGVSEFKDAMERKFFHGFWERYEIEFFLFNPNKEAIVNYKNVSRSRLNFLESIISKHSVTSEIDSNIFFIKDFTSQYSYIIRQPIYDQDSLKSLLFCGLKSKRIPEKIGFPKLLLSSNARVFEPLEEYSIAKYYNGKLVSRNGKFSYPSRDAGLTKNISNISGYFNSDGYNHYLFRRTERDSIVLSRQNHSTIQFFTSFSYLFSFYGLFLLIPIYIRSKKAGNSVRSLTLAVRIQIVLIGLVFIALVAFGWGSGLFVRNQYQAYTNELIRERIHSVEIDLKQQLGETEELSVDKQGDFLEYALQNLSSVFVTDINLYDRNGFLLASSRPKVYNIGLISEQMNRLALNQLKHNKKSEFFHQEKIGNLDYLSGYVPFYSSDGNLLAYLNLQHFGQQKGFEDQIQEFLVAIMNVFILLLALSIIVTVFVSTWVTSPLRILQQNFAKVQLGKYNQPIEYAASDEIGILVKEYNQKLEELAFAAQQLAQSERESAWREMAKQVAHEIKNPLTPMKLSLQQLQRVFDPTDPNSKEKIDKVASSIIGQIDALAKIANEFSNFAKMPKAQEVELDLIPLIEGVLVVFSQEVAIELRLETSFDQCWIRADKDLMLRVFNNLIKNAIQAIPAEKDGKITVKITSLENRWLIAIEDNGKGIPVELHSKLFVPYFTTKSTGTGLGLAMVKQIVEMHQGKIWFDSSEKGTTFWIEISKTDSPN